MDKRRLQKLAGILTEDKAKISKDQKHGFHVDVEKATKDNEDFRRVLYTTEDNQLVLMTLQPGEDIGAEVHEVTAQFFRFEEGEGKCEVDGTEYKVKDGDSVIVPQGVKHNIINTSDTKKLKLYTLYSPPVHDDGLVFKTKKEAEEKEKGVVKTHSA